MTKYKIEFHVKRIEKYNVYKTIEADSLEDAKKKAQDIADDFCAYTFDDEEVIDMPEEEATVFEVTKEN